MLPLSMSPSEVAAAARMPLAGLSSLWWHHNAVRVAHLRAAVTGERHRVMGRRHKYGPTGWVWAVMPAAPPRSVGPC